MKFEMRFSERNILLGLIVMTLAVLWPAANGEFVFDDISNITSNPRFLVEHWDWDALFDATFSSDAGVLKRPISMFTLALNAASAGLHPRAFIITNIVIHVLAGLALFRLVSEIQFFTHALKSKPLALWVTAFWLISPVNLFPAMYVVQRMTSLSALFVFMSLTAYLNARRQQIEGKNSFTSLICSLLVFFPLGVLSKESALLTPLYAFLLECYFIRFQTRNKNTSKAWLSFYAAGLLAAAVFTIYMMAGTSWLKHGYAVRDFNLSERLLTENRILWTYIINILTPRLSELALFRDDIPLSTSLLQPLTTILSLGGHVAAIVGAVYARKKTPILSFGISLYYASHLLESTLIPLELFHWHRNYLGSAGIYLGLCDVFLNTTEKWKRTLSFLLSFLLAISFVCSWQLARLWGDSFAMKRYFAENHPNSSRLVSELGAIYGASAHREKDPLLRERLFEKAISTYSKALRSNDAALAQLQIITLKKALNKPVSSTEYSELYAELNNKRPSSDVLAALTKIVESIREDKFPDTDNYLIALSEASATNPLGRSDFRVPLMNELGLFWFEKHDLAKSIAWFNEALRLKPNNFLMRMNRVLVLIAAGQLDVAHAEFLALQASASNDEERQSVKKYSNLLPAEWNTK